MILWNKSDAFPSDAAKVLHLQSSAKSSVQHHHFCFFSQGPDEIHVSALIVGLLNLRPKPSNSDTVSAPSLKNIKPPYMSCLPPTTRVSSTSFPIVSKLVAPPISNTSSLMALKIKSKCITSNLWFFLSGTESVKKQTHVWWILKTFQPSQGYVYSNLPVQKLWSWMDDLRGCSVLPNSSLPGQLNIYHSTLTF